MNVTERAEEVGDTIYTAYGTDMGILFGIPAECKSAVIAVIRLVLEEEEDKLL